MMFSLSSVGDTGPICCLIRLGQYPLTPSLSWTLLSKFSKFGQHFTLSINYRLKDKAQGKGLQSSRASEQSYDS